MFSARLQRPLIDLLLQKQGVEPVLKFRHPVSIKHCHDQDAEKRVTVVCERVFPGFSSWRLEVEGIWMKVWCYREVEQNWQGTRECLLLLFCK